MDKTEWYCKLAHAATGLVLAAVVFAKIATSYPQAKT